MRWSFFLLAVFLAGCATSTSWVTFPDAVQGKGVPLDEWLKKNPMSDVQDISIEQISRGDSASSHIVRIRKQEPMHIHKTHDVIAILLKGKGILTLGSRQLQLVPGSIVSIPRGMPHSFQNQSPKPATVYATFSPAFDGTDFVPIQE